MLSRRSSGILLHITSLPGRFGIGTLGKSAFAFVDFLVEAGQRFWQILPHCPVSRAFDCSPYMGLSAFAGNPLLIDPAQLVEEGWLDPGVLAELPSFSEYLVDFDTVIPFQEKLLEMAFEGFSRSAVIPVFERFIEGSPWLADYALFASLREEYMGRPWHQWPTELVRRQPKALEQARRRLVGRIRFHQFVQFCFARQWHSLLNYAHQRGLRLIGDIPIYVALDSADVWVHQDCFLLDQASCLPLAVAGVPPDYFSKTGQRWGNPLFRWYNSTGSLRPALLDWWEARFRQTFALVDVVRIDHFRGFESYWQIPATEETAVNGKWVKGPGLSFLQEMERRLGSLPIIAEDLGIITPEVEALRDAMGFPGMKILQFAFDSDQDNAYLPHNYRNRNCVVYTGTHDNDTTVGWYLSGQVPATSKERALRYAHSTDGNAIHWDFIRMAYASVANLAILPLQDVLGFGSDCRMNLPGTAKGNWRWRCAPRFLTQERVGELRGEVLFYNRLPVDTGSAGSDWGNFR